MTEKIEWEVLDAPSSETRLTLRQLIKKLLGPWWRWKVAGAAAIASLTVVFVAALMGMIALVIFVGAILSLVIGKIRQWLHRGSAPSAVAGLQKRHNTDHTL